MWIYHYIILYIIMFKNHKRTWHTHAHIHRYKHIDIYISIYIYIYDCWSSRLGRHDADLASKWTSSKFVRVYRPFQTAKGIGLWTHIYIYNRLLTRTIYGKRVISIPFQMLANSPFSVLQLRTVARSKTGNFIIWSLGRSGRVTFKYPRTVFKREETHRLFPVRRIYYI